tara:strand:- start:474 stop:872 length:399 start_codon:yes stop_codon:yes gene_type:complete
MLVHVLLYESGNDNEGIHSLELNGNTVILMFEDIDDAERYCGLLEAQDFPTPTIEKITRADIEHFCTESGYESRYVEKGFVPMTEEDRLLITPPQANQDVSTWSEDSLSNSSNDSKSTEELDQIKKRLENLL